MYLLNNSLSLEEVKIILTHFNSSNLEPNKYINMLVRGDVTNILLTTGAVIHYRDGEFTIDTYNYSSYYDVLPILEFLGIKPEFSNVPFHQAIA